MLVRSKMMTESFPVGSNPLFVMDDGDWWQMNITTSALVAAMWTC